MGKRAVGRLEGPKCIAIVGPFASGKTTLLEAILARTGAIPRQNSVASGNTVSDHSAEARAHQMSVEASVATTEFMGDSLTFVDCPGSIEFAFEAEPVLAACDMAVVVAEADEKKIPALQLIMRKLDEFGVPRILFLNKIDKTAAGVRDTLKLLQPTSKAPLLLRQIPLRKDGIVIGSIDLALERAYIYREYAESEIAEIPGDEKAREIEARFSMLETLADHDDQLMEQLLDEIEPPRDAVFDDLTADLRAGLVTPVLIGTAEKGNGVLRLLKAIRHDAPDVGGHQGAAQGARRQRRGRPGDEDDPYRAWRQAVDRAHALGQHRRRQRAHGVGRRHRQGFGHLPHARQGPDQAHLGQSRARPWRSASSTKCGPGDTLSNAKGGIAKLVALELPPPVFALALKSKERKDDVKLSSAIHRIAEEDPSLLVHHHQDSSEMVASGHGEMHLRVTLERLEGRNQIAVEHHAPAVPYRETIRKSVTQRGRHKKQSGGHGQFGDVVIDIKPLPRGSGFQFTDTITGGVVPKTYIPSVETGVRDYLRSGPLGFPVVDVAVNLADGSYHSVDSSDMAFQMAAKLAMKEGMANCSPVLLEPVMKVEIYTPSDSTAKITAIVPQRRGQILGYDARPGWPGWDVVEATMPQSAIGDLIIELRSATAGVASYSARFDHMAELTGRLADDAMSASKAA